MPVTTSSGYNSPFMSVGPYSQNQNLRYAWAGPSTAPPGAPGAPGAPTQQPGGAPAYSGSIAPGTTSAVGGNPMNAQRGAFGPGGTPSGSNIWSGLLGFPAASNSGLPSAPAASPGNIQPSNPQPGAGPYGGYPQVPDPFSSQRTAIGGNQGNLGGLSGLSTGVNTTIANNAALPYGLNLPGYQSMLGQSSGNILSLLKGQVPQDVANQIAQMAAERGVATGSIGSPNANTALLRSLGLTSLGLQQQGESELTGAIGRTPTGQQFNPASFLVSPGDTQASQYLANLLASAPDPRAAAAEKLNAAMLGANMGGRAAGPQQGFQPPAGVPSTPFTGYPGYPTGTPALGGQNPPSDRQGYATQYPSPIGPQQYDDFWDAGENWDPVYSSTGGDQWQTGMPFDNYSPDLFGEDIFG